MVLVSAIPSLLLDELMENFLHAFLLVTDFGVHYWSTYEVSRAQSLIIQAFEITAVHL